MDTHSQDKIQAGADNATVKPQDTGGKIEKVKNVKSSTCSVTCAIALGEVWFNFNRLNDFKQQFSRRAFSTTPPRQTDPTDRRSPYPGPPTCLRFPPPHHRSPRPCHPGSRSHLKGRLP